MRFIFLICFSLITHTQKNAFWLKNEIIRYSHKIISLFLCDLNTTISILPIIHAQGYICHLFFGILVDLTLLFITKLFIDVFIYVDDIFSASNKI